jgi:hypothetical protein
VTFTAHGIPGLSSDAPELALELFNLVRATPRAVSGQLESVRAIRWSIQDGEAQLVETA